MRLKSEIWIKAFIRRVQAGGSSAYVMRRGDGDAGAILIVVSSGAGAALFAPAIAVDAPQGERRWALRIEASDASQEAVSEFVRRESEFDPDIWVIEVEDREGRHFLGDELAQD